MGLMLVIMSKPSLHISLLICYLSGIILDNQTDT